MSDTKDKTIGKDCVQDLKNMEMSLSLLADACAVQLFKKELMTSDGTLTKEAIRAWVKQAPIEEDDVVIFYFSGHGYRDRKSKTIWPYGQFDNGVVFSKMIDALFSKKAAFYIVLLDCCNNEQKCIDKSSEKEIAFDIKAFQKQKIAKGVGKLFLHPYGLIIASAASPGEIAHCLKPPPTLTQTVQIQISSTRSHPTRSNRESIDVGFRGGVFTTAFLTRLFQECEEGHPKWKNIFKGTHSDSYKKTRKRELGSQTVQYKIFLHSKRQSSSKYKEYLFEDCKVKEKSCDVEEWEDSEEELNTE